MHVRHALVIAVLAGCGTDPDPRPATFAVVAQEILAPSCGQVQCHSTTTRTQGYAFDTLDDANQSLLDLGADTAGTGSELWVVLTADGGERMPPDWPLNQQDLDLIKNWLAAGAPGLVP